MIVFELLFGVVLRVKVMLAWCSFHECVHTAVLLPRFPCSSTRNYRELYEADPDDSPGSAGVKVTTVAAAPL